MLFPLCSLAFLVLFLAMEPQAYGHLKYRIGIGSKPSKPQQHANQTTRTTISKVTSSSSSSSSEVTSHMQSDVFSSEIIDYDTLDGDELERLINRSSTLEGNDTYNARSEQTQL